MRFKTLILSLLIATCLLVLVSPFPVQAATGDPVKVLYQNSFSSNPKWVTNNPSSDYWDPGLQMYHFAIEPSTGAYAYTSVSNYDGEPFTFEYDLILNDIDDGATFRLGFSGTDMDPNTGPNILTQFTNAKYGQIMWLHLVTPSNKMIEVNSESGDTQASGDAAYNGPTVKYSLNTTYHVTVDYRKAQRTLSMKVNEKTTGKAVWGYYVNTAEDLRGMNRIYLGSIGDYGRMNIYAKGYIDNVRLTIPADVSETPTTSAPVTTTTVPVVTTKKTTPRPTTTVPTPSPETTPESPLSGMTTIAALGITGLCCGLFLKRRN
ncbi:MAG: hypothetical protein M0R30_12630 [Methanoregula sp.]|jgi:hypothetical protein|uniref:hypothetical protein n=1 Tax=Methanoregula sp. TaxID=2052170 RepID=UPI0025D23BD3|nr:hypothetical protein [Methanoregula sp.]MCK9632469.1 hypothetical protein [Methanoregula sp.]